MSPPVSDWPYFAFLNVAVFLAALFLSSLLSGSFIRFSFRFNLLDYPEGRKTHRQAMPFMGGAAVFVSFWLVIYAGLFAAHAFDASAPSERMGALLLSVLSMSHKINGIFLGGALIWAVGFYDDKFRWKPVQKLTGQAAAALVLMKMGLAINLVQGLGPAGFIITFIWIVMITNAFNFIDSLDGHSAGIAFISCLTFFSITQIIDQPMVGLFLLAFAGSLLGFLPRNFSPAKIFLGDNGSLFIGYMMAAFTLLCKYQVPDATYVTLLIPVLVFGVPIYDMLSVIVVRLARGVKPWEGDRNHFAHRLVKMGMSDRVAVIFSYFIAATIGFAALLTTQVDLAGAVLICLLFASIIAVIAFLEYYSARRARIVEELARQFRRRKEDVAAAMTDGINVRPWGRYDVLLAQKNFQVKRIEIKPDFRFSLQKHSRRAEKWIILEGQGVATVGSREIPVRAGSFVEIAVGEVHRLHNTGKAPLVFVEAQFGDYLGEDDIVRLEDDFNRK